MNIVDHLKRAIRRAPPPPARQQSGSFKDIFDCERAVMIIIDERGRVFQVEDAVRMSGGSYRPIPFARTEVLRVLDLFDVQDATLDEVAAWVQDASE